MSDSIAGAAAWLGGTEIVNDSRTTAYMRNGIKAESLIISGDCGCSNVLALAGCDDEYTTPAKDNAPWYDPAIPESAEFAGFLSTEFDGLNSTYTRSITESISDGATLGRSRFGSRTMSWRGFLFGSSCCGVAYGLRWLGKILQGTKNCGNNCFGDDLELLVCCPTMEAAKGFGPNIACNSSFTNNSQYYVASGNTVVQWTDIPNYSGIGALKVFNPLGGPITFNTGSDSGSGCFIPVNESKSYKLSLYAKGQNTGTPSQIVGVTFNWYNNVGSFIGQATLNNIGSDNGTTWTLLEGTATAPLTATSVRIEFVIGNAVTLPSEIHVIDDVSLNQLNFAPIVDPFRTIKNVSLLEGPVITGQRKLGSSCGGNCGGSTVLEVEFSLVGAQPWLYSAPIPVANCVPVDSNSVPIIGGVLSGFITDSPLLAGGVNINSAAFASLPLITAPGVLYITLDPTGTAGQPEIVLVTYHTVGSTTITVQRGQQGTTAKQYNSGTLWKVTSDCAPVNCGDALTFELNNQLLLPCSPPKLPPTSSYVGCYTPDYNSFRAVYITAPRAMWSSLSEVVPVITIQTGGLPLIGSRIGFYSSADGNPCGDLINVPPACDLICDTLGIVGIPANSKFYIDGRTNKISLICGTNAVFPGEPYTLGPFSWPSFDCYGFCMEFAYNPNYTSDQLCVSLSLVPRTTM